MVDSDGDVENSKLSSSSEIGGNSTSASESEFVLHSSDEEKEIADTEVSDQDVWDQLPLKQSDAEVDKEEVKHLAVYTGMFLSFFQLCYRVSEQGISLLLAFLRALLLLIISVWPNSLHVSTLRDILT